MKNKSFSGEVKDFGALNLYEVSWVEHNLREIKRSIKNDYERNIQYAKFFKKLISRSRPRLMTMSKEGLRVGRRRSRAHT